MPRKDTQVASPDQQETTSVRELINRVKDAQQVNGQLRQQQPTSQQVTAAEAAGSSQASSFTPAPSSVRTLIERLQTATALNRTLLCQTEQRTRESDARTQQLLSAVKQIEARVKTPVVAGSGSELTVTPAQLEQLATQLTESNQLVENRKGVLVKRQAAFDELDSMIAAENKKRRFSLGDAQQRLSAFEQARREAEDNADEQNNTSPAVQQ